MSFDNAAQMFRQAIADNPQFVLAYKNLAILYQKTDLSTVDNLVELVSMVAELSKILPNIQRDFSDYTDMIGIIGGIIESKRLKGFSLDEQNRLDDAFKRIQNLKPQQKTIFISYYQREGGSLAAFIHSQLRVNGFAVFSDNDIAPADDWRFSIDSALAKSRYFILIVTPGILGSKQVRNEIDIAVRMQKETPAIRIIPIWTPAWINTQQEQRELSPDLETAIRRRQAIVVSGEGVSAYYATVEQLILWLRSDPSPSFEQNTSYRQI
jgi:hypothetical protein